MNYRKSVIVCYRYVLCAANEALNKSLQDALTKTKKGSRSICGDGNSNMHMQMMRRMGDRQFTFYHEPEARSQHNCRHCNPACKCLSMNVPPHTRFCKQCPHHPEFHLSFSHALFADDCGEVSMLQDAYERLDAHIADAMETA